MSKFKVGDKVIVNGKDNAGCQYEGKEYRIRKVLPVSSYGRYIYDLEGTDVNFCEEELDLIKCKPRSNKMNIVTLAKFIDKDQRALYKAGLIDSAGQLTEDGQVLVLEQVAQQPPIRKALLDIAKEYKAEKDC